MVHTGDQERHKIKEKKSGDSLPQIPIALMSAEVCAESQNSFLQLCLLQASYNLIEIPS